MAVMMVVAVAGVIVFFAAHMIDTDAPGYRSVPEVC